MSAFIIKREMRRKVNLHQNCIGLLWKLTNCALKLWSLKTRKSILVRLFFLFFKWVMKASMAVMLDFLARTAYFLQLSNDKFERQNIINSDRWKVKDFEFSIVWIKRSKRLRQILLFAVQILAINSKNKRAWNLIKFSFINLIQIILLFTL